MRLLRRLDSVSGPALLLVGGRTIGFAATFATPIVLARLFDRAEFGTYKQLFLLYGTLFGLAQLGIAESLYYFVPRAGEEAARLIANAVATLAVLGTACVVGLAVAAPTIAAWFANPELSRYVLLLAAFLALMLVSTVLEIVLTARQHYVTAAVTYALSDIGRTLCMLLPLAAVARLEWVLVGAVAFAAVRVVVLIVLLWRTFGSALRLDLVLWRQQLAYALPFALAVSLEIVQTNLHQYVVASQFDAAMFAIYAVGCLQIPLVDVVSTSTTNVLMVKMAEASAQRPREALALWHQAIYRMALVMFPLTAFLLVSAHDVIVALFTATYVQSVPIFRWWTLMIPTAVLCVDAVLRAYAQTGFLFRLNLIRLTVVVAVIGWLMGIFGMAGAVIATLVSVVLTRILGVVRIAKVMNVRFDETLPWRQLATVTLCAMAATLPVLWTAPLASTQVVIRVAANLAVYAVSYGALVFAATHVAALTGPLPTHFHRRLMAWFNES